MSAAEHMPSLPTDETPVADAAEIYARAGLAPVPLYGLTADGECTCSLGAACPPRTRGKHPVGDKWQERATVEIDAVRDRFRSHRWNVGIYLPIGSHVLIDADGAGAIAQVASWQIPKTLTQQSGSGSGAHYIYRLAPHHDPSAITDRSIETSYEDKKKVWGIDVKVRGQFVAAPSRHASGNRYRWTEMVAIATLPDWLYDRIKKQRAAAPSAPVPAGGDLYDRARRYVDKIPGAIAGSGGHDQTFTAARALAGWLDKGLAESHAWALLLEYNGRCEPPWSEKELEHKWTSAKAAHSKPALADRPKLRVVRAISSGAGQANDQHSHGQPVSSEPAEYMAPEQEWRDQLMYKTGRSGLQTLVSHVDNIVRILQLDPRWSGKIAWNAFRQRVSISCDLPWDEFHKPTEALDYWTDSDATRLCAWLKRDWQRYGFDPSATECDRAVEIVAKSHSYHPVRDYLESVAWDASPRLSTWTTVYLGAEDTEYHRLVGRWWLLSAVARIFEPGCKVDTVPILEGPQGQRKSTAIAVLAGEWFSDAQIDITSKDAAIAIQGFWMNELAEVDALMKAEPSEAKAFLSRATDRYRPPYMKHVVETPRQSVFVGTTNLKQYLDDPTGARRYQPIACGRIDIDALRRDRDQLFAEAVAEFRDGRRWYPENDADRAITSLQQETRTRSDSWEELIAGYLRKGMARVTTTELLTNALDVPAKDHSRASQMRVGSILTAGFHWEHKKVREGDRTFWAYVRP